MIIRFLDNANVLSYPSYKELLGAQDSTEILNTFTSDF